MVRIDNRTVELTDKEVELSEAFEGFLDDGFDVIHAMIVLKLNHPRVDHKFFEYLAS